MKKIILLLALLSGTISSRASYVWFSMTNTYGGLSTNAIETIPGLPQTDGSFLVTGVPQRFPAQGVLVSPFTNWFEPGTYQLLVVSPQNNWQVPVYFTVPQDSNTYNWISLSSVPTNAPGLSQSYTMPAAQANFIGSIYAGSGVTLATNTDVNGFVTVTISSSGGGGTVTNFSAGGLPPLFTASVGSSNTNPSLSFSPYIVAPNSFYAGPVSGGSTNPNFRQLGGQDFAPGINIPFAALSATPLTASSNLSDLSSAATARANLGLGTAATNNGVDVYPSQYGVVSTGSNDVTAGLQAMFAAWQNNSNGVRFDGTNGHYLVNGTITNWSSHSQMTRFNFIITNPVVTPILSLGGDYEDVGFCSFAGAQTNWANITNVVLWPGPTNETAIATNQGSPMWTAFNGAVPSIAVWCGVRLPHPANYYSEDITIHDCHATNFDVGLVISNCDFPSIKNCEFMGNALTAVFSSYADDILLEGLTVSGASYEGGDWNPITPTQWQSNCIEYYFICGRGVTMISCRGGQSAQFLYCNATTELELYHGGGENYYGKTNGSLIVITNDTVFHIENPGLSSVSGGNPYLHTLAVYNDVNVANSFFLGNPYSATNNISTMDLWSPNSATAMPMFAGNLTWTTHGTWGDAGTTYNLPNRETQGSFFSTTASVNDPLGQTWFHEQTSLFNRLYLGWDYNTYISGALPAPSFAANEVGEMMGALQGFNNGYWAYGAGYGQYYRGQYDLGLLGYITKGGSTATGAEAILGGGWPLGSLGVTQLDFNLATNIGSPGTNAWTMSMVNPGLSQLLPAIPGNIGSAASPVSSLFATNAAIVTETVGGIGVTNLTASRVLVSDGASPPNVTNSGVSTTTLGYLDATSSIQGQLNGKAGTASPVFTGVTTAGILKTTNGLGQPYATNLSSGVDSVTFDAAPGSNNFTSGRFVVVIDNTTAIGANSKAFDIVFPGLTNVPRHALLTPHIGSGISSLTTASASALAAQLKQFLSLWPPSNYYTNGQFSIYNTSSGTTGGSGLGTTVMFDYQVDY